MATPRKLLALALAALILMVAGCGGSKTGEDKKTAPAPDARKDPVTITFWHGMSYDSAHGRTLQALVKEFNDTRKDIIVTESYQGSYSQLEQKVMASIAAKTPPTVIQNTDSMLTKLVKSQAVQDLTTVVPPAEKSDYPESMLGSLTFDGKLYALPFNKSLTVLIYDKKLVPSPPKTWGEFRNQSKAVTVPNKTFGTAFEANEFYFGNLFVQAGGQWTTGGKTTFNDEAGVQALQFIVDMAKEGTAIQLKPNEYQSDYFNQGRAAMIATTSASLAFIKPANGNPWGVAPMWAGPKNDLTGLAGANLSIVAGVRGEESQAAQTFSLWLTGKEGTLKWAMAKTGYMPVRKSAVQTPEWQKFVKDNPEYEVLGSSLEKGTTQPNHPQWGAVQKLIRTAVENAVLGKATPKAALDEAAIKSDELLKK